MKKIFTVISLVSLSFGFTSCCSMFGLGTSTQGSRTETTQVETGEYEEVHGDFYAYDGAKGSSVVSKKPIYKTVTKKVAQRCPRSVRPYCASKGCGGTTTEAYLKTVTSQGHVGSPNIGLVPTMKKLAE